MPLHITYSACHRVTHTHTHKCVDNEIITVAIATLRAQSLSCVQLCDPMNCRPPGSSDHEIFQARILQWVAISFSKGSFRPRDQTFVSCVSCIAGRFLTHEPSRKPLFSPHVHSNTQKSKNLEWMVLAPGSSGFSTRDSRLAEAFLTWTAPQKGS